MHLIEILLPLFDRQGNPQPSGAFLTTERELIDQFGGITSFIRSPAEGKWKPERGEGVQRDQVVVCEVMVERLDRAWWKSYRERLKGRFDQEELLVRASVCDRL